VRALVMASMHARYTGWVAVPLPYRARSAEQFASRYLIHILCVSSRRSASSSLSLFRRLWYTEFSFASEASFAFERQLTLSLVTTAFVQGESGPFMCCAEHGAATTSKKKNVNDSEC